MNAANVALMPKAASEAAIEWQADLAHNGSNNFDDHAEADAFEGLHTQGARLFGCRPTDIAGGSSCTELLASIAWAVMPGPDDNVVSTDIAFPSAVYPWSRIGRTTGCEIRLATGKHGYAGSDEIVRLIDHHTAVVCVSHVEYTGGQRYDLESLADAAHAHDALLVVDASQSAGAIPIDAPASGADVIVTGSYKWLCGPYGAAVMYVAPHLHTKLEPGLVGFRSHRDMWDLNAQRLEFADTAHRFEASTLAFGAIKGLERSIEYLVDVGIDRINAHNLGLADRLIRGLHRLDIRVVSPLDVSERTSIVTCRIDGIDPLDVVNGLKTRLIAAQERQEFVRFSPHLYNTVDDIDRTLAVLGELVA